MKKSLELHGAYGRDTNMTDWAEGKDFKILGGPYCSIRDLDFMMRDGYEELVFVNRAGLIVDVVPLTSATK